MTRRISAVSAFVFLFFATVLLIAGSRSSKVYALTPTEIDDDEYNLYVGDYPDEISNNIYAKFSTPKSNSDEYYLDLTEDDAAIAGFTGALSKSGIPYTAPFISAMTPTLIYDGGDEEVRKTDKLVLLLPLPDDAQEHPDDCNLYSVSSGKASPVSTTLIMDDCDTYYFKFTLSSYTTYGFTYNDPESYEEEDEDEDYEDEEYDDPADAEDEEDDDSDEDEESDEYEDFDEDEDPDISEDDRDDDKPIGWNEEFEKFFDDDPDDTPDVEPEDVPDKPEITDTPSPTATPVIKPTATPTPKPSSDKKDSSGKKDSSSKSSSDKKDSIPKTGDDFPLVPLAVGGGVSLFSLTAAVIILKKKH